MIIYLTTLLLFASNTFALDTSQCITPLGMEHGLIRDEDITASSSFDSGNVGPQHGRIRTESHGGAWCPKHQITSVPKEWLEIDLRSVHMITSTGTQGRFGNGQGREFAEAYMLEYWRPKLGKWVPYRNAKGEEKIKGNTNTYLESKNQLDPPIWASRIRFLPHSYHRRTVCMRVEVYGCYWNDGVVSYSMPQGDKRGSGWEFYDTSYDGHWDGELGRGLGLLTDGKVGPDNFKMAYYDVDRGQGWVGWRNDTRNGQPIDIKFEFDQVREFTAVHIYCNNQFTRDVQVFSLANIMFSIGGKYYIGEPISYNYFEDRIFENSRNITIKLHHRVGRFVKLQLHFAAKWMMISEITFDSDVAHGNFTTESMPSLEAPAQGDIFIDNSRAELPVSTTNEEEPTYMAVIIGVLTSLILLLGVAIFFIVHRHRQRKCFASPLLSKSVLTGGSVRPGSSCGIEVNKVSEVSYANNHGGHYSTTCANLSNYQVPPGDKMNIHMHDHLMDGKMNDYQEPYQALKYAPYYSYSAVVAETGDPSMQQPKVSDTFCYDYAVPELQTASLLAPDLHLVRPGSSSDQHSTISFESGKGSRNEGKLSPSHQEVLSAIKRRLEQTSIPEFPRHRLRMLSKLADGAFGTVYIAEADSIAEYGSVTSIGRRLVAVKFLLQDATEKQKNDFHRDVHILSALEDTNIARVLGICTYEEPFSVVMEYLDHGDLCQFLRTHCAGPLECTTPVPLGSNTLSFNCLLYMATQIASGMKYLESMNFVHRDLATRNCLIGKAYEIKISDFCTDNEMYALDYYKVDDNISLPIRWMAWESVFQGIYSTKSDVWSFSVTLAEILNLGRFQPLDGFSDTQVMVNLSNLFKNDGHYVCIPKPVSCPKDVYDLMCECWKRNAADRPSFREIHLFLLRKNLGYSPMS